MRVLAHWSPAARSRWWFATATVSATAMLGAVGSGAPRLGLVLISLSIATAFIGFARRSQQDAMRSDGRRLFVGHRRFDAKRASYRFERGRLGPRLRVSDDSGSVLVRTGDLVLPARHQRLRLLDDLSNLGVRRERCSDSTVESDFVGGG